MRYRMLGRTELQVSELGLGALEIGRDWPYWRQAEAEFQRPDETVAVRLIHRAIDLGVNFIDTAPAYFKSEELLGLALEGKRHQVFLATKCGEWFDGHSSNYNYSYDETFRFMENSLRLLKTDYVDLLQIHSGSLEVVQRGETMTAMKILREQGKARFLGISVDHEDAALAAIHSGEYDCIQLSYNLLNRVMEHQVLSLAKERNIGIIVKDALHQGKLTHKHLQIQDEDLKRRIAEYDQKARSLSIGLPEYALRFVLANPIASSIIAGTKSIEHLEANVRCTEQEELTMKIDVMEK
ncbi:MAG: aldo/keto reductase [bacterium]